MTKTARLITTRHVCAMIGASRSTLYRWVDTGDFPPPVVIRRRPCGRPTSIRWIREVVEEWLESRRWTLL